jgi:hypothetical protein
MTNAQAIEVLKSGQAVKFGWEHNQAEMKVIFAAIKSEVPTAWVSRSPSTNNWTVYPA